MVCCNCPFLFTCTLLICYDVEILHVFQALASGFVTSTHPLFSRPERLKHSSSHSYPLSLQGGELVIFETVKAIIETAS